ncbi:hypothetical protein BGZ94_005524 [Podila epigama]|nr:hypothetical protein BGZ94_005524 [Podila epigama]
MSVMGEVTAKYLCGLFCLRIAARYEDGLRRRVELQLAGEFQAFCNEHVNMDTLQRFESQILSLVESHLHWPGPMMFLRRCFRADDADPNVQLLGEYLLEVMLRKETFLEYPPSLQAAAAMYLARRMYKDEWTARMEYSGYEEEELQTISFRLVEFLAEYDISSTRVYKAYNTEAYMYMSREVETWAIDNIPSFVQQQQQQHQQQQQEHEQLQQLQQEQQHEQLQQLQNHQQERKNKRKLEDHEHNQEQQQQEQVQEQEQQQQHEQEQEQQQQQQQQQQEQRL